MIGTGTISTTNSIQTDSLTLQIAGSSKAQMEVEIVSKLDVVISGTGEIKMSGNVRGNRYVRLTGTGEFDGRKCAMKTAIVDVTGVGTAYVIGEQAVDVVIGGIGHVYYYGPLRNQRVNGLGSIESLSNVDARGFRSSTMRNEILFDYCFIFFLYYLFSFL